MNWLLVLQFWLLVAVVAAFIGWIYLIVLLHDSDPWSARGWRLRALGIAAWYGLTFTALTLLIGFIGAHLRK
jgi:hypothetical protein